MKTWRLVSGILSIVLSALVLFQSCAAGMLNALEGNGNVDGSGGMFVAIMLLVGGIVSIATRNSESGGHKSVMILYSLGAVIGFVMAGGYFKDLYVWSAWCAVCAVLAFISLRKAKKSEKNQNEKIKIQE